MASLVSSLPSYLQPFFSLQYPVDTPPVTDSFPDASYYGTGKLDACLIVTLIAIMAVLRDGFRLFVFEPFARWKLLSRLKKQKAKQATTLNGNGNAKIANGNGVTHAANGNGHAGHANGFSTNITRKEIRQMDRSVMRFAEQGWSVVYYVSSWFYGLYIHRNLPTQILNPEHVWKGYPHIPIAAPLKFYYILQTASYVHQVLILNAEARRKDHWQMMAHHVITITLLVLSYFYNCTRVGILILFLMDWCDILLPLAKMLRYLSYPTLCDAVFVVFLVSWFVTRHVLYNIVVFSTYTSLVKHIALDWIPERGYFLTEEALYWFKAMLISLQIIQIVWFGMICRVAWRVVTGNGAEDTRSDDESDDGDEKES